MHICYEEDEEQAGRGQANPPSHPPIEMRDRSRSIRYSVLQREVD